jgi:cell division FtsZ-interacting protein ZapD
MTDLINYISNKEIKDQTLESINQVIEALDSNLFEALRIRDLLKEGKSLADD